MFENDGKDEAAERWHPSTLFADIITATRFLTRVPVRDVVPGGRNLSLAMGAFPVVGAVVGLIGGMALLAATGLGLSPLAAAAVAVACQVMVTGGLHEDGLADTADGVWGAETPERRLAIMRDAHIGSYGVLALVIAVILKCALLAQIMGSSTAAAVASLAAAGAVSRHAMVALMSSTDAARSDGLAASTGKPAADAKRQSLIIAVVIAVVALWWVQGFSALFLALLLAQAAVTGITMLARHKIGGHTGDVCGAVQQVSEIAVLAGVAMAAG